VDVVGASVHGNIKSAALLFALPLPPVALKSAAAKALLKLTV
jgi:hypothetical protein